MLQSGLHAVSVREILEFAQVSRRTFYQYFSDKNGLLLALHEEQNQALLSALAHAIGGVNDPAERLTRGVEAYLDLQAQRPLFSRLQAEAMRPDSVLFSGRAQTIQGLVNLVAQTHHALFSVDLDPDIFRTVIVGVEGLTIHVGLNGALEKKERIRIQAVIHQVLRAVLIP
jgi:AcrR family transcriptional regulator